MQLRLFSVLIMLGVLSGPVFSQCRVISEQRFASQNKRILLATPETSSTLSRVIVFRTTLRVNTDGSPNSYHPVDLAGDQKAINNICNGVSVYKVSGRRKTKLRCIQAQRVFAQFRDSGWKVPRGYSISWQSVIAARKDSGRTIPCVFETGEHAGYLGSLTSLKNDLPVPERGECEVSNQLDQRFIPAFVMPLGVNPLSRFGAAKGDLVFIYNPVNQVSVSAIIGDLGPSGKLGEGSVGLNSQLLGRTGLPTTYRQALGLDTGRTEMLVAILPGSRNHQVVTPYTRQNIKERAASWVSTAGFPSSANFLEFLKACDKQ